MTMSPATEDGSDGAVHSRAATDAAFGEFLDELRYAVNADTAAILLFDESRQFLVATAARGIEEEVRQGVRIRAGVGFAGQIAARRTPVILDEVTPNNVVNPLLLRKGIASMLGVPLMNGTDVLGVAHVGSLRPRRFSADDVSAVEKAARRITHAAVQHRLFVDRTAAAALQRSLSPRLPDLPGLELASRYVPGSQYGVGGDWYDIFALPDGLVGVTIGDVMGHGLHAATVMGRLRSALRAYALEDDSPASVLERLDRKIQHFEPGHLSTVTYALLDPSDGTFTISTAGHVPPILADQQGPPVLLELPIDPPLGVEPGLRRRQANFRLDPGSLLCLYTDGLVERRTGDLGVELDRLRSLLVGDAVRSAEAACAEVMTVMLDHREAEDDISLLVMLRSPDHL